MKSDFKKFIATIIIIASSFTFYYNSLFGSQWFLEDNYTLEQYYKFQEYYTSLLSQKKMYLLLSDTTSRPYDVQNYDIYLDWYDIMLADSTEKNKLNWKGRNNIILKITSTEPQNHIELDAIDLLFTQISVNGNILETTPQATNGIINIPIPTSHQNDIINLNLEYTYLHTNFKDSLPNRGFGFYLGFKGKTIDINRNYKIEEQVAYTVNSPQYARFWLPCNDRPRDKAIVSMSIVVPDGFTAASNGMLNNIEKISAETGEVKKIFKWSDDVPIATYLINATASIYEHYTDKFKSPNRPDSVENHYYIWAVDTLSKSFTAKKRLQNTTRILEFFSNKFIDYPFCKYGQIAVYPFNYGAMENQTLTTLGRILLSTAVDAASCETTVAHEISHQWFGDLVSAISWDDIWFKEGAATWSEALWTREVKNDTNKYYEYMKNNIASRYLDYIDKSIFNIPIHGNPPELIFAPKYVPLTYHKASWVYHQLMMLLGEELHFRILKELLEEYKFKNVDASIFCNFYKEKTKDLTLDVSLDKFFDQWLYKAGHPIYNITTNISPVTNETMSANIILTQTQTGQNITEVFETPVDILFCRGPREEIVHRERVINNQRTQEYTFENIPNFDKAYIDPSRTLCENKKVIASISENKENLILYPNPVIKNNFIYLSKSSSYYISDISIYNSLGMRVDAKITNLDKNLQIDIRDLETGIYYIIVHDKVLKFSVIK